MSVVGEFAVELQPLHVVLTTMATTMVVAMIASNVQAHPMVICDPNTNHMQFSTVYTYTAPTRFSTEKT
jgi:hypothetical protein